MRPDFTRRRVAAGLAGLAGLSLAAPAVGLALPIPGLRSRPSPFKPIEDQIRGRLGVSAIDTASGRRISWRGGERFPMCSTFKLVAVAFVLARVDQGVETLSRKIRYTEGQLLPYAPVTRAHVADGELSLRDLCAAAVEQSDNTAANLILDAIGGPIGLTAWLRRIGDAHTRLDRMEPSLNTCIPGDPRDTTTPDAMAATLVKILTGTVLTPASREQLLAWMVACRTGETRLKAGLTPDWRAGDKTGTGDYGTTNDFAIFWPPRRRPIIVSALITGSIAERSECEAALADVGRAVEAAFYG